MVSFNISAGYGFILLELVVMVAQCHINGFLIGQKRRQFFTKEFFEKHFPHLKDFPRNGYPEMGQGRYSDKLTDEQWIEFNNYQRAHNNYLEGLPLILIMMVVSGLNYTFFTFILGIVYIIGRQFYSVGYQLNSGKVRIVGTILFDVVIIVLFIASLSSAWSIGGGLNGLKQFVQKSL